MKCQNVLQKTVKIRAETKVGPIAEERIVPHAVADAATIIVKNATVTRYSAKAKAVAVVLPKTNLVPV